jgi:hypothetical protein
MVSTYILAWHTPRNWKDIYSADCSALIWDLAWPCMVYKLIQQRRTSSSPCIVQCTCIMYKSTFFTQSAIQVFNRDYNSKVLPILIYRHCYVHVATYSMTTCLYPHDYCHMAMFALLCQHISPHMVISAWFYVTASLYPRLYPLSDAHMFMPTLLRPHVYANMFLCPKSYT